MGEADSITGQLLVTHLFYTVQDPFSAVGQSTFQNNFHTLLFVFWWTKSQHPRSRLSKRLNGEADFITGQLLVTHLLYTVQDLFSTARQSSFQNNFHTLLFVFWQTKLSHHRSRLSKRLNGEADFITGQLLVTHLLYTVRDLFSVARHSSFPNNFHTLLFVFWWTKSQHPRSRLSKRLNGEADSIMDQLLVTHLLYTVQDLFSTARQSSFQNNFHTLLFVFWQTKLSHHRSRLRKRLYG